MNDNNNSFFINDDMAEIAVYFHSAIDGLIQENFKGMCRNCIYITKILSSKGQLTMGRLAESMNTSKEQVSRSVKSLVQMGYVQRTKDPSNMRLVLVSLTPKGQEFLDNANAGVSEGLAELFSDLTDEQVASVNNSLSALASIIHTIQR